MNGTNTVGVRGTFAVLLFAAVSLAPRVAQAMVVVEIQEGDRFDRAGAVHWNR